MMGFSDELKLFLNYIIEFVIVIVASIFGAFAGILSWIAGLIHLGPDCEAEDETELMDDGKEN